MQLEIGGFSPAPDVICQNENLGPMAAVVFGKVWRYCQMSDRVCKASMERIARECGISRQTALTHVQKLVDAGYLIDTTPTEKAAPHVYRDTGKWRMKLSFEETPEEATEQASKILTPPLQNLEATPPKFRGKDSIKTQKEEDDDDDGNLTPHQKAQRFAKIFETDLRLEALAPIRAEMEAYAARFSVAYFRAAVAKVAMSNGRSWNYLKAVLDNPNPAPRPTTARPEYRGKRVSTPAPKPGNVIIEQGKPAPAFDPASFFTHLPEGFNG